jgi:hypothetical protein
MRQVRLGEKMSLEELKSRSPFYPGQPVPQELFVGRRAQIERILQRGVNQTKHGKPTAFFVQGEYGIGKSSIAGFVSYLAESDFNFYSIYAPLAGAKTLEDVATAVFEATIRAGAFKPHKHMEQIRGFFAKYIKQLEVGGVSIDPAALQADAPSLSTPYRMLDFLEQIRQRTESRAIFLILDEINGIATHPDFAYFIKGLVDQNALSRQPLPLLLMLCGVEERRREMIRQHTPIDRIFDIITIEPMTENETQVFFQNTFQSVHMTIDHSALTYLVYHSAGFPKIMHLLGDVAFWIDRDGHIDKEDALHAIVAAATEVGQRYVDQQVYKELRSQDYRSILSKIGEIDPLEMSFTRARIAHGLTETEKSKLDHFLKKMKLLNVIKQADNRGEYIFNSRMVRLYIWLKSIEEESKQGC